MADPSSSRSPLTLDDLLADLVWPRLLRAARIALRPARVGLGAFFLIGCAILLAAANKIDGDPDHHILRQAGVRIWTDLQVFVGSLTHGRPGEAVINLVDMFIGAPAECLRRAPWAAIIVLPLLLTWTVIIGGAISRSAATEIAWSRTISWPESLAFSLRRRRSLIGAAILPILAIWLIALALAASGWALFNLPVLRVIGGLAWGVFILAGLLVAILMLGFVLGHSMLVPAVVCEGADSIDAVQHAYALAFARPVRLVAYILLLLVQAVVLAALVVLVLGAALWIAQLTAGAWTTDRGGEIIAASGARDFARTFLAAPDSPAGGERIASTFVRFWSVAFFIAGLGAAVSYWWSAATALFLVMRRICDGQDISELWSPGMVEGTVVESLQARGPAATGPSQAIVDNGAADEG